MNPHIRIQQQPGHIQKQNFIIPTTIPRNVTLSPQNQFRGPTYIQQQQTSQRFLQPNQQQSQQQQQQQQKVYYPNKTTVVDNLQKQQQQQVISQNSKGNLLTYIPNNQPIQVSSQQQQYRIVQNPNLNHNYSPQKGAYNEAIVQLQLKQQQQKQQQLYFQQKHQITQNLVNSEVPTPTDRNNHNNQNLNQFSDHKYNSNSPYRKSSFNTQQQQKAIVVNHNHQQRSVSSSVDNKNSYTKNQIKGTIERLQGQMQEYEKSQNTAVAINHNKSTNVVTVKHSLQSQKHNQRYGSNSSGSSKKNQVNFYQPNSELEEYQQQQIQMINQSMNNSTNHGNDQQQQKSDNEFDLYHKINVSPPSHHNNPENLNLYNQQDINDKLLSCDQIDQQQQQQQQQQQNQDVVQFVEHIAVNKQNEEEYDQIEPLIIQQRKPSPIKSQNLAMEITERSSENNVEDSDENSNQKKNYDQKEQDFILKEVKPVKKQQQQQQVSKNKKVNNNNNKSGVLKRNSKSSSQGGNSQKNSKNTTLVLTKKGSVSSIANSINKQSKLGKNNVNNNSSKVQQQKQQGRNKTEPDNFYTKGLANQNQEIISSIQESPSRIKDISPKNTSYNLQSFDKTGNISEKQQNIPLYVEYNTSNFENGQQQNSRSGRQNNHKGAKRTSPQQYSSPQGLKNDQQLSMNNSSGHRRNDSGSYTKDSVLLKSPQQQPMRFSNAREQPSPNKQINLVEQMRMKKSNLVNNSGPILPRDIESSEQMSQQQYQQEQQNLFQEQRQSIEEKIIPLMKKLNKNTDELENLFKNASSMSSINFNDLKSGTLTQGSQQQQDQSPIINLYNNSKHDLKSPREDFSQQVSQQQQLEKSPCFIKLYSQKEMDFLSYIKNISDLAENNREEEAMEMLRNALNIVQDEKEIIQIESYEQLENENLNSNNNKQVQEEEEKIMEQVQQNKKNVEKLQRLINSEQEQKIIEVVTENTTGQNLSLVQQESAHTIENSSMKRSNLNKNKQQQQVQQQQVQENIYEVQNEEELDEYQKVEQQVYNESLARVHQPKEIQRKMMKSPQNNKKKVLNNSSSKKKNLQRTSSNPGTHRGVQLYQTNQQKQAVKMDMYIREKSMKEKRALEQCTFQPQTNSYKSKLSFQERNEKWMANREQKIQHAQEINEMKKFNECTFNPQNFHQMKKQQRAKVNSNPNNALNTNNNINTISYISHSNMFKSNDDHIFESNSQLQKSQQQQQQQMQQDSLQQQQQQIEQENYVIAEPLDVQQQMQQQQYQQEQVQQEQKVVVKSKIEIFKEQPMNLKPKQNNRGNNHSNNGSSRGGYASKHSKQSSANSNNQALMQILNNQNIAMQQFRDNQDFISNEYRSQVVSNQ